MIIKSPDYFITDCGRPQLRDIDWRKPFNANDLFMLKKQTSAVAPTNYEMALLLQRTATPTSKLLARRETLTQHCNRVLLTRTLEQKLPAPKRSAIHHTTRLRSNAGGATASSLALEADQMNKYKYKLNDFIKQS